MCLRCSHGQRSFLTVFRSAMVTVRSAALAVVLRVTTPANARSHRSRFPAQQNPVPSAKSTKTLFHDSKINTLVGETVCKRVLYTVAALDRSCGPTRTRRRSQTPSETPRRPQWCVAVAPYNLKRQTSNRIAMFAPHACVHCVTDKPPINLSSHSLSLLCETSPSHHKQP